MSSESASFQSKLLRMKNRFQEVEDLLSGGAIVPAEMAKLSKELSDLRPIVEAIQLFDQMQGHLKETEELLAEGDLDKEMKDLAREENIALKESVEKQIMAIKVLLLPKDEMDDRNAIMEIRAGTGGDEAGLFAADMLRMYQRYAEIKGWKVELMDISDTGVGGIREASLNVSGKSVFAHLKFESGVHRVQRVPETEASGRIHTSAATVAVLPEAEEVDVVLEDKDLKIDVYRSSGPGGQSVNTTDSAVRITHLPTGIVVQQQDEKSQHKNKAKALKILRARILDKKCQELADVRSASRKNQIGTGDRSERIRTYNFPQGRVTDHRINLTLYKLDKIINGEALDELVEALVTHDQAARLADEG